MGIKDLSKIVKKYPNCIKYFPIDEFKNKRIAFDGNNLFRKYWSTSCKNVVSNMTVTDVINTNEILNLAIDNILKFIIKLLYHKITLIFVFDGGVLKQKQEVIKKRKESKEKAREDFRKIKEVIEDDIFNVTKEKEEEFKMRQRNSISPSFKDMKRFQEVLESLGIPILISTDEAERLCVSLYLDGKIDGVYTNDRDVLAFGCKVFLEEIVEDENRQKYFRFYSLEALLEEMEFTFEQFVDLCIMLSCDYNERIFKVGPKKCEEYIRKYKKIEAVPIDTSCLNHEICREIFKHKPSDDLTLEGSINLSYCEYEYDYELYSAMNIRKEAEIIIALKRNC